MAGVLQRGILIFEVHGMSICTVGLCIVLTVNIDGVGLVSGGGIGGTLRKSCISVCLASFPGHSLIVLRVSLTFLPMIHSATAI